MPATPEVSVLVVSYRTRELTLECLRSLYAETRGDRFETIVVDNASDDGSAEAISREFPQVRLIASEKNLGFAAGNNLAAEQARGRYLLLLNPDTVVLDGAVDRLVDFAERTPRAGIWGGRTLHGDRSLNPGSCWGAPTLWSTFCLACGWVNRLSRFRWLSPESLGRWQRDTVREVDIVSGCFLLILRDTWSRLRGFDPAFFMYGEDADLCLRARASGARPIICPEAVIVHYGGASERVRADKMIRLYSAKARLFKRHWSRTSSWLGVRLLDLAALLRTVALGILSRFSDKHAQAGETWSRIWSSRGEWHEAYRTMDIGRQPGSGRDEPSGLAP